MRTIIENREGLEKKYMSDSSVCYETHYEPREQRSCFYDFGKSRKAHFVKSSNNEESKFVDDLIKMYLQ